MDKSSPKRSKIVNFGDFLKSKVCRQTVLPDRSIVVGQKMVVKAKILGDFQTMCMRKGASADDNLSLVGN